MEFVFSGKITFEDYVQFSKFILRKILLFKFIVYIFCLILIVFISGFFDLKNGFSLDHTTILMGITFFLLIYIIINTFFSKKKYRKIFDSNKTIKEEGYFTIDEKNITISSVTGNSTLSEETIYKIVFDKDSIYVFIATNIVKIIKKRFLKNGEEYERMVVFIKENYRDKIRKK